MFQIGTAGAHAQPLDCSEMELTAAPLLLLQLTIWIYLVLRGCAEYIGIQEFIAKLALGIVFPGQCHKLGQLFI